MFTESSEERLIIPLREAEALVGRCERGETAGEYRYGMHAGQPCYWMATAAADSPPAGSWRIRGYTPRETQATVYRFLWSRAAGGSERETDWALTAGSKTAAQTEGQAG